MPTVSGRTAVYGVVGDPVAHSLTPALHAAAFDALGVDAVSVALTARVDGAGTVVDAVRRLGIRGLSVTMPLKAAVVAHCEARTDVVERLGAANFLAPTSDGGVLADSTDGDGLVAAIACVHGSLASVPCCVLGAGGAARAAIDALARAGASEVSVVARRAAAAHAAAAVAEVARVGGPDDAARATVVVQATPVGMLATDAEHATPLVDGARLRDGQVAVELVYHPRVTPWLRGAAEGGAVTVAGAEVLVHQAQLALERWLGREVPVGPLHGVVR